MAIGRNSFTTPKPPVDIELFIIYRYMGYPILIIFKFNWESKPLYCSIVDILCKLHYSYFITSTVDDISILIYMCVFMKINGVTSIGTQNKSHTTHLYLPSIIFVHKHIQSIKHKFLYILHIYINMYITSIFCTFYLNYIYYINTYYASISNYQK